MKKKNVIIILVGIIILFFVFFWRGIYAMTVFKSGKVKQEGFFVEKIPFRLEMGLPVIKVKIGSESYHFLYDTGAVNLVSSFVAEKHSISEIGNVEIYDSQGSSANLKIGKIDDISIGGINFLDMATLVSDKEKIKISCLEVDGIIGVNLMRKVIWKLDFERNEISISDRKDMFDLKDYKFISFSTNNQGTPIVELAIDTINKSNPIIDTGYNGEFFLSEKYLKDITSKKNIKSINIRSIGSQGLFLEKKSEILSGKLIKFPKIRIGDYFLENEIIEFSNTKNKDLIGSGFLKNFHLVMDWTNSVIYLKRRNLNKTEYKSFGFFWGYSENKVLVTDILTETDASEVLSIGDQLIQINEHDLSKVTENQWCSYRENVELGDSIFLKIKRNDTIRNMVFNRKFVFQ